MSNDTFSNIAYWNSVSLSHNPTIFARNSTSTLPLHLRDAKVLAGGHSSHDTSVHRYYLQYPATVAMATRAANKRVRLPLPPITHDHYADIPYSS